MRTQFWLTALVPLCTFPTVEAREVVVDDPGTDNTVLAMDRVPNILGFPDNNDPPLEVISNVPVSILRYYDGTYMEGQQPVQKQDVYIIVKSNCSSQLDVQMGLTEYDRSNITSWDPFNYTESISIDVVANDPTVTLVDSTFLETSKFLAYWNYSSYWCYEGVPGFPNTTEGLENTTSSTTGPTIGSEALTQASTEAPTEAPTPSGVSNDIEDPIGTSASNLENNSAGIKLGSLLTTIMAGVLGFLMMARHHGPIQKGNFTFLAVLALVGILLVSINASSEETLSQQVMASAPLKPHGRRLQEEPSICAASVEIILDGCRRAMLDNKVDMIVEAPATRILVMDVSELSNEANPDDPCTTDYVGAINVNATISSSVPGEEADNSTLVESLTEDWTNGIQCARMIEGRPFVDDHGSPLHAQLETHQAAWSADKPHIQEITIDTILGKEWADRALGEHASVPAFAAFTIALMSNNAPPKLVEDALTAAMDEVRHAKTSFEVASLLLGTIVEPGPIPPSSHSFMADMKSMALAAAQEGCIDETLSALAAAYDVDTRLDQNTRISDTTKSMLKDKVRTIALEEARHSGLAWRTVHWACKTDSEVCSHVEKSAFESEYLQRAFENRFGRHNANGAGAQNAWQKVTSTLIPFVLAMEDTERVDCEQAISRHLNGATLLEEMAMHIIHNTVCA